MNLYSEKIEQLINMALADGELTEKEKQILFRRAEAEGIDLDEFEMVLDARLHEVTQAAAEKAAAAAAAAAAATHSAAPKSQKFGDIRKCPACGAIVATGSAVCLECGYAFNEDAGTSAMEKLYERLAAIDNKHSNSGGLIGIFSDALNQGKKEGEKMAAIRMFNVPNTRSELLGLLTSLQPLANPKGPKIGYNAYGSSEDLSLAYWDLFVNCINKARISFANDKSFEPYFNYYNEMASKKSGLFGGLFGRK